MSSNLFSLFLFLSIVTSCKLTLVSTIVSPSIFLLNHQWLFPFEILVPKVTQTRETRESISFDNIKQISPLSSQDGLPGRYFCCLVFVLIMSIKGLN